MKSSAFIILLTSLATACGGGDGSDSDTASNAAGQDEGSNESEGADQTADTRDADDEAADESNTSGAADEAAADGDDEGEAVGSPVSSALPVACSSDADCPDGIECFKLAESDEVGFCNVEEAVAEPDEGATDEGVEVEMGGGASLAAPAICSSDAECPEGIECLKLSESDEFGYCNVEEVSVEPDPGAADEGAPADTSGGVSLATPAICSSDAECPEGIECLKLSESDEFGYCNVEEVSVDPAAQ